MKRLAAEEGTGMSLIVRAVAGWVAPFILLYGLYSLSVSSRNPGGAFESGVILACGFILLLLAFGKKALTARVPLGVVSVLVSVGGLIVWVMAFGGVLFGTQFMAKLVKPDGAGVVPYAELGFALEVMAALVLLLVTLSALRVKAGGTDEEFRTDIEEE